METFVHNPRLAEASTPPSSWYSSSEVLEREYRKVFNRAWALVGRTEQVQNPGDYFTSRIGRENVVLVMTAESELRGYVNVCRHRAGPVATGSGNLSAFKCLYHGWTYDLQGQLRTTPEFQGVENFNREDYPLPRIQVRTWGPLVFAAIDPVMSFEDYLGGIPAELDYLPTGKMRLFAQHDYEVEANWKVYVDNYLEGYHIPAVHPSLNKELDYKEYKTEVFAWHSTQQAPPKSGAQFYGGSEKPGGHYYWLFPNLMLNIYQGIMQTNVVIPRGPDQCTVRFEWFASEREAKFDELQRFSDLIQAEDADICRRVHQNLKSVTYSQGRYCVKRENGLHHFHGLLAKCLD